MASEAEDLIKRAVVHRESGRIEEAIIAAKRATVIDPDNANSWWQLGLAVSEKHGEAASIPHFTKTVELADGFSLGWFRLGASYKKTGMLERAIECWEESVRLDDNRIDSLAALVVAYQSQDSDDIEVQIENEEKLFEVLKTLDKKRKISLHNVNALGAAYHKRKDFHQAIRCFRTYASRTEGPIGFFNLGLALSAPDVSQDADAVDAWRRALVRDAKYEKAKITLSQILPRMLELRNRVLSNEASIIGQDQWYEHYVNPFELLNLTDVDDPFDLEVKTVQRAKKMLLQEIELEDGLVEWVPGLRIDKSRAIKVVDEITGGAKVWHHKVYQNKPLLNFMSRGDVLHFLVDEHNSPIKLLEAIDDIDNNFPTMFGEKFAAQFNIVFSKAIEKRNVDVIECMLDGRRFVMPKHEDKCFDGAHKQFNRVLEPLRQASEKSEKIKPRAESIRSVLAQGNVGKIIELLPSTFQNVQYEAASIIRSVAINAYNVHGDADLAKEIAVISMPLAGRSNSVLDQIKEDMKTLDERIRDESKDDASLTYGGANYSITRKYVTFATQKLSVEDVRTLRWGIEKMQNGMREYSITIGGMGSKRLSLNWRVSKDFEAQHALFSKLTNAALSYLMPRVIEMIRKDLDNNQIIQIGAAPVSKGGVTFTITGWFSSRLEICPWNQLRSTIENGDVIITDYTNSKAKIALPLATVDNAIALYLLIENF
jgi:tetratricopeptide (TPR) repeat protein